MYRIYTTPSDSRNPLFPSSLSSSLDPSLPKRPGRRRGRSLRWPALGAAAATLLLLHAPPSSRHKGGATAPPPHRVLRRCSGSQRRHAPSPAPAVPSDGAGRAGLAVGHRHCAAALPPHAAAFAPVIDETLGAWPLPLRRGAGSSARRSDLAVPHPSTRGSAAEAAASGHPLLLASLPLYTSPATRYR